MPNSKNYRMNANFKLILVSLLALCVSKNTNSQSMKVDSLTNLYIQAQTSNQLAQAEYYAAQKGSVNSQLITVIGTLGGSLIGLLGALFIAKINSSSEQKKQEKQILEERNKNLKIVASELMKKTAEGFHSLTWVLWIAKNTPEVCTPTLIDEHDQRMKNLYSEIAGAQVALAAYSKEIYEETEHIIRYLYRSDGEIGRIGNELRRTDSSYKAINRLGMMWQEVYIYSLDIPKKFSSALNLNLPTNS